MMQTEPYITKIISKRSITNQTKLSNSQSSRRVCIIKFLTGAYVIVVYFATLNTIMTSHGAVMT